MTNALRCCGLAFGLNLYFMVKMEARPGHLLATPSTITSTGNLLH
jgi:hypothetical protein